MRGYRFHYFILSFLSGVAVATALRVTVVEITWLCLIAFGLMLMWRIHSEAMYAPHLRTTSIMLVLFAMGMLRLEVASWSLLASPLEAVVGQSVELVGVVEREPDVREHVTQLSVRVADDVILVTTDLYSPVAYGDTVVIEGVIEHPTSFTSDLGRVFHYEQYLLARGIVYTISFAEVEVRSSPSEPSFLAALYALKQRLMTSIEQVLPEPQAGLGEGLLLGVKQALGKELEETFRIAGLTHIIVLSGYNIMLVVAFVMYFLGFFLRRTFKTFVGVVAIVCFALLVGPSATVVRASIMASLLLVASALGRTYDVSRSLLFAGMCMVFFNPYLLLYDIGFQFSFMATVGLIMVAPHFESLLLQRTVDLPIKEYIVATVATQIAVLPLLMFYIGQVSLVAVVANVFVLPIVPAAMLLTFLSGVLNLLSSALALPLAFLAQLTLSYIIQVATWCAALPFAAVEVPLFPAWGVGVLYGGILLVVFYSSVNKKPTSSSISDWTIEEEKTGEATRTSPAQVETPIFFR